MTGRRLLLGLTLAALLGLAGWFGWRWYTTPRPPHVPLDGIDREVAEAVEKALQEVRRRPRSGEAWGKLSLVLAANGFEEPAIESLTQAERFDPNYACWPYLRGFLLVGRDSPGGLPPLRRALTLTEQADNRGALLFLLVTYLLRQGQFDEAQEHLRALRQSEGDSPRVRFLLGRLALLRGDETEAREHMASLTESPFARKQACSILAGLLKEDPARARAYEEKARQLPRDLPWPIPFQEQLRTYKVERQRGIEEFRALESQGRAAEAVNLLRRLVAESPDAEVCLLLGDVLADMGAVEEAAEVLRTALALDPRSVKAHSSLAAALLRAGEKRGREPGGKEQALAFFRQAVTAADQTLALQSNHGQAHLTRGKALKELGRTEEALRALREAVVCQPELSDNHLALGEALAEAGQLREALEHLENAVRLAGPNDPRPKQALEKWRGKKPAP